MKSEDKIIVAIDTDDLSRAKKLVKNLWPRVKFFKIGLEMINTGKAPELIKFIKKLGGKVFYDAKLNDIPNTVAKAVSAISKLKAEMITVHASSGSKAMQDAVKNKGGSKIIGVTVLTSIDNPECKSIFGISVDKKVIQFADTLLRDGVDGLVCSVREGRLIRKFKRFTRLNIITPGIRPVWAVSNEQVRTATPAEAIKAGADYLVIGRPIINPPKGMSQGEALGMILKEINRK